MLLSIPYTFVSREHFWNFATSDLAAEFLIEPHENGAGVRGIFYGEEGFRHFFTKNPVNGLEDLKGMKLRVSNDPIMNGMVEGLGASPTVVAFGELYSALVVITDEAWDGLTENQQNAIMEAGKLASEYNRQISEEAENKVLEELKAAGCNVVEVTDKAPWQEACKKVVEDNTASQAELYQKIVDMQ